MAILAANKMKKRKVDFVLEAPEAKQVSVVGSFNAWSPKKHPMKKDGNGLWRKTVMLPTGAHEYKFLVDGCWIEDPKNERQCANSFGSLNSIVCVLK